MDYIKLCDVCDFQGGSQPPKDEWSFTPKDGYVRMLQIRDFTQGERVIPEYIKLTNTTKICEADDILIARYGASLGKILTGLSGAYNVAIMRTIPNTELLEKKYLYYYLKAPVFQNFLLRIGNRAAQAGFNKNDLQELLIPCVSRERQKEVVCILEKVETLICALKQQLQKLDELVKARFVEMFGDPLTENGRYSKVPLGSLAEVGSSKRIFEKEYVSEGIPFYRTKEIVELSKGNGITTELFITKERYDEICSEYGAPQKGDLLISAVGTIGVIWIVDGKNDFYFKDGNLLRVSVTEKFVPEYLKHLLEALISAYKLEMSSGTAYAALTISALKKMIVYDVPHAEQEQFAAFVEQTDKSKVAIQKALVEAQLLFDSLMQKHFG